MPSSVDLIVALLVGQLPLSVSIWGLSQRRPRVVTVADRVTLIRAAFACGCAFLATLALLGAAPERSWWLVTIAIPTLLLDALDGWVARRTGTASEAGAAFDMELDAGVVLILSVAAALALGPWVLLVGAFRYVYAVFCWLWPRLATPLPRSQFRRVVGGIQGAALTVALMPIMPIAAAAVVVALALGLLTASFSSQAYLAVRWSRQGLTNEPGSTN